MKYSFKKGLWKGIVSALTFVIAILAFTQFSDVELWALVETYIKPLLGSMTVAGTLTMVLNYIKVKAK